MKCQSNVCALAGKKHKATHEIMLNSGRVGVICAKGMLDFKAEGWTCRTLKIRQSKNKGAK